MLLAVSLRFDMDSKEKRRLRDAKRTVDRLHHKFISKYVEAVHGDIFVEAQEIYESIRRKNPGTKDLTKTVDFMNTALPNTPVPFYYFVKQRKGSKTGESKASKATRASSTAMSHMALNIPLISLPLPTATDVEKPPSQSSMPLPSVTDVEIPPSQSSMPLPSVTDVEIPPSQSSLPLPSVTDVEKPPSSPLQPQLDIPANVYADLLQELRQDPELWKILNDFNQDGICDIEQEYDEMVDLFEDPTPLERELQGY